VALEDGDALVAWLVDVVAGVKLADGEALAALGEALGDETAGAHPATRTRKIRGSTRSMRKSIFSFDALRVGLVPENAYMCATRYVLVDPRDLS
jgi:hypothetical protein